MKIEETSDTEEMSGAQGAQNNQTTTSVETQIAALSKQLNDLADLVGKLTLNNMKAGTTEPSKKARRPTVYCDADSNPDDDDSDVDIDAIKISRWRQVQGWSLIRLEAQINTYIAAAARKNRQDIVGAIMRIVENKAKQPINTTKAQLILLMEPSRIDDIELEEIQRIAKKRSGATENKRPYKKRKTSAEGTRERSKSRSRPARDVKREDF